MGLFSAPWRKNTFAIESAREVRMNWHERIFLVAWLSLCFAVMTEGTLWAGDCSGENDCGAPPDNGSRAAGIGGALAGGGLALNSHRKRKKSAPPSKPDPCAGEARALLEAQGRLAAAQGQRDAFAQQVTQLATQEGQLISRGEQLLSRILSNIKNTPQELQIRSQLPGGSSSGLDAMTPSQWQAVSNLVSGLQGADIQSDVQEFVRDAGNMVNIMGQLGNAKKNWETYEDAYLDAQRAVTDAQFALDDCRASHSGDAQSQGDSAQAPS